MPQLCLGSGHSGHSFIMSLSYSDLLWSLVLSSLWPLSPYPVTHSHITYFIFYTAFLVNLCVSTSLKLNVSVTWPRILYCAPLTPKCSELCLTHYRYSFFFFFIDWVYKRMRPRSSQLEDLAPLIYHSLICNSNTYVEDINPKDSFWQNIALRKYRLI